MTEQEAVVFIQNAMQESRNAIAKLMFLNPKIFEAKAKILGKYYSNLENCKQKIESCDIAIKALEEIQKYREIGTVEECRAAVEKQKANKIVHVKLRQSEWGSEYRCPVCESDLIKTVFFNEDGTEPDEKISWCSGCGQKLDWSDEE